MSDIKKTFVIETKVKDTQKAKKALGELDTLMSPTRIRKGPDVLDRTMGKVSKKFDTILKQVKTLNSELQKTAKNLTAATAAGPTQIMQRPGVAAGGPAAQPARRGMAMADVRRAGRISNMAGRGLVAGGLGGLGAAAGGALFLGGLVGGVLQTGQQAANLELSRQRAMLGLGANVNMVDALQARNSAMANARIAPNQARIRAAALEANAAGLGRVRPDMPGTLRGTRTGGVATDLMQLEDAAARSTAQNNLSRVIDEENARVRGARSALGRRTFRDEIGGQIRGLMSGQFVDGRRLSGMNQIDTAQFLTQATRGAGGLSTMGAAGNQQFAQAALAAQTLFGVGPEVSGAFLAAERKGGIGGAEGGAGLLLSDTIGQALATGLDNSDVRKLLSTLADSQQQFIDDGLSLSNESIMGITRNLDGAGMSGARRLSIGTSIARSAQRTGLTGIQSDRDVLLARFLGGMQPGGNFEDFSSSMFRMMEGNFATGPGQGALSMFRNIIEPFSGQGDATAGRALLNVFPELGKNALNIAQGIRSGSLTEQGAMTQFERGIDVPRLAADMVGAQAPGVARQARIDDRLTRAGSTLLQSAQNMQEAAATQVTGLSRFGGALDQATQKIMNVADNMEIVAEHWANKAGN